MRSETLEGVSRVIVEFKLERDLDGAVQDVRDKIATVIDQLPEGTKAPLVQKFDLDSMPVGDPDRDRLPEREGKLDLEIARRLIKEPLESVTGSARSISWAASSAKSGRG